MIKLSDVVQHVYTHVFAPLLRLEVKTKDGWEDLQYVLKTETCHCVRITTSQHSLICSDNHIVLLEDGTQIFAKDTQGKNIQTDCDPEKVLSVEILPDREFYDLSLTGITHTYFADGILSHNCVVMDEAGFVPNNVASKVFESIYPVISSSKKSQFIMVSTPNGADPKNLYYEIWLKANSKEKGKNSDGWKPFRFDWFDVPGRDEAWKQSTIESIGQQRFDQEFGNIFLTNAQVKKLIPDDIIEKHRIKLSELKLSDTEFVKGKKQQILSEDQTKMYEFTMWHEFNPKRTYLASGDCAEGIGGDDSVLYVWDVTDLSNIVMCAKFDSNKVSTVEFAFITRRILKAYNDPYYICERNGVGSGYLDSLRITYGYQKCTTEGKNGDAGVYSHAMVKGKSCIWAREMMTTDGFNWTIYDKDLINEMDTFVRKENKGVHLVYQAVPPAHDDHIMAWIWACYILQPELVEKYFVCAKTFRSQLDKTYPQRLEPLKEYSSAEVKAVTNDPLYQEFLDFKDEMRQKLGRVLEVEKNENTAGFFRKQQDIFFGGYDDGPSWNSSQPGQSSRFELNSDNRMPSFFINAGGGFM